MEAPTKAALRAEARRILGAMPEEARAVASAEICRRIRDLPEWTNARVVGVYSAKALEPDLTNLVAERGKLFCYPKVAGDGLEFHRCDSTEFLQPGPWGMREPGGEECPVTPPVEIELMIIPGLAFTRAGARVGRGGGFYDRFLTRVHPRAFKIGVCFHAQLVAHVPTEGHDRGVDFIATEMDEIRCASQPPAPS